MRALPHDGEFERAALASALLSEEAMLHLLECVHETDWYFPQHRVVYNTIKSLHQKGKPVDIHHVLSAASSPEIKELMAELFDHIPSANGIVAYCNRIIELSDRRRAIKVLQDGIDALFDPESEEPIAHVQSQVLQLVRVKGNESRELVSLVEDAYGRTWEAYQARLNGVNISASHITTGLVTMDEVLSLKRGDMVVIGARPSAGKTSVGVQMALHAAKERPMLFFSLEEPANQIADRYLTAMTGINMRRIQEGKLTADEMERISEAQSTAEFVRLVVNDTPGLRVSDMRAIALRLQAQRGVEWGAIMIDHMVKVRGENPSHTGHHKLTQVSQDIKNMARAMRIPVIVLTQLRRPQDETLEPNMSDLRESGSIEEDADSIILIHRPDRENKWSTAKFLLKKQRTGACGSFEYLFEAEKMRFSPVIPMKAPGVL